MDSLTQFALHKALEQKAFKAEPGSHTIDSTVTLRVTGTVNKGNPYERTPTVNIPLLTTLAFLLEKSGAIRPHLENMLKEAMVDALKAGDNMDGAIKENIKNIEASMAGVVGMLGELPKVSVEGRTTCKLSFEVLDEK